MKTYTPNAANDSVVTIETDGSDSPSASVFNTPVESLSDTAAYFRPRIIGAASTNWRWFPYPTTGIISGTGTFVILGNAVWDPIYYRWVTPAMVNRTGTWNVETLQSNDGINWEVYTYDVTNAYDNTVTDMSAIISPVDGACLFIFNFPTGSTSITYVVDPTANTWTRTTGGPWQPIFETSYTGTRIGTTWSVWAYDGGSLGLIPQVSTNGTTWANAASWSPPGGFYIGTSLIDPGRMGLAIWPISGGPTITEYMYSSDGTHWSQQTLPVLASGEVVTGSCVDSFSGKVYLQTSTTGVGRIWSSPSLSSPTWTLVYTATQALKGFFAGTSFLQANGREMMTFVPQGLFIDAGDSTRSRIVPYRTLDGTATWQHGGQLYVPSASIRSLAGSTLIYQNFTSNGQAFAYSDKNGMSLTYSDSIPPTVTL